MKNESKQSLLGEVIDADYDIIRGAKPHSPSFKIENLKRQDKIVAKMRKAGITDEEINFFADLSAADAVHVFKLVAAADAFDAERRRKN